MNKAVTALLAAILVLGIAGQARAGCDGADTPYPTCECNPRGNLSTDPKVNDCLNLYDEEYVCISTGSCCTAPGACGNGGELVATCNGICKKLISLPRPALDLTCGNGALDPGARTSARPARA